MKLKQRSCKVQKNLEIHFTQETSKEIKKKIQKFLKQHDYYGWQDRNDMLYLQKNKSLTNGSIQSS